MIDWPVVNINVPSASLSPTCKAVPSHVLPEAREQWRLPLDVQCAWVKDHLRLVGIFKLLQVQYHLEPEYLGADFVKLAVFINVPHRRTGDAVTIGVRMHCDRSTLFHVPLVDKVWNALRGLLLHELGEGFEWDGRTPLDPHENPGVER